MKILIALMLVSLVSVVSVGKISNEIRTVPTADAANFFPVVKPNKYFVIAGGEVTFHGIGFAANEPVDISANSLSQTIRANSRGAFTTGPVGLGYLGGNQTFMFSGENSGASFATTVNVADWNPYLLLSNYYNSAGSAITITGHQFGANEQVDINFGGQDLGMVSTNSNGIFIFRTVVPSGLASGVQTVVGLGSLTGKSAITNFTAK